MSKAQSISSDAENVSERILAIKGEKSFAKLADELGENRGYLYRVCRGQRPASNRLRVKLGLHLSHVEVEPLACGHAPIKKNCPMCTPRKPRRNYDISYKRLRELRENIYLQS